MSGLLMLSLRPLALMVTERLGVAVGSVTHTYDSNGNLNDDGVQTYTYDALNRMISASDGVGVIDSIPAGHVVVARMGEATLLRASSQRFIYS